MISALVLGAITSGTRPAGSFELARCALSDHAWSSAALLAGRKVVVAGCIATLIASSTPALAENCQLDCFRECDKVAPGNREYCSKQCDSYCEEEVAGAVDQKVEIDSITKLALRSVFTLRPRCRKF